MRPAPPLTRLLAFPVITAVGAMAIFVTIAIKTGRTDIAPFTMSSLAFDGEPWRLASSALPHIGALHLIFNLVWLWILGTRFEEELGHVATFAIMLVLAVGSAAAEYAFAAGGVGLSGVGYGLVGCLLVLARRDGRFRDAIDTRTVVLFVAWGVLCIITTVTGVMEVGNVAHASGFVLGLLMGQVIARGPLARRGAGAAVLALAVAALVAGAAEWRPELNVSSRAAYDDAYRGWHALGEERYDLAARHLERALALDPDDAGSWFNYGIALHHVPGSLGMTPLEAWQHALALEPDNPQTRDAITREQARVDGQGAAP